MSISILVVDDSLPMRHVIIKTIKASGYQKAEYLEAANGVEAIEKLQNEWIDIVVTDHNMPNMNGMELIVEMKKDDTLQSIPILVITTEGSQSKVEEFMAKGASGYLKKPFKPEAVREKIIEILGETEYEEETEDSDDSFDF